MCRRVCHNQPVPLRYGILLMSAIGVKQTSPGKPATKADIAHPDPGAMRRRSPVRLVNCNGEAVLFGDDNSLRRLRPGSGARRSAPSVLEPRRRRESASTNNGLVFAAGLHRRIKRSVVAVQTIVTPALPVVDHRQYGAERLTRLSERH